MLARFLLEMSCPMTRFRVSCCNRFFPRFAGCAVAVFVTLVAFSAPAVTPQRSVQDEAALIDNLVGQHLKEHGQKPNPIVDDGTFVRRAYLDIVGRIPSHDECMTFLSDEHPEKRKTLVFELLKSDGYVHHYFHFWADLLRYKSRLNNLPGTDLYGAWIRDSLATNKPYDAFVRELLTAEGHAFDTPTAGYFARDGGMPLDHMANTVQVFLGTRIQCAQCHNHPFDVWTQKDFYGMAAYTFGVQTRGETEAYASIGELNQFIRRAADLPSVQKRALNRTANQLFNPIRSGAFATKRKLKLPKNYEYDDATPNEQVAPAPLFGKAPSTDRPRHDLASWMTAPENDRFTRVIANRLWKRVMGVGLVEPVDDFTQSTLGSNPALLEHLEDLLIRCKYNLKYFLLVLHSTDTYQCQAEAYDDPNEPFRYPGPALRRMTAEQVWDSIMTLMIPDVDQPSIVPRPELERQIEFTRQIASRANTVRGLSTTELHGLLQPQIEAQLDYTIKRQALMKKKESAPSRHEAQQIGKQLRELKKEFDRRGEAMFEGKSGSKSMMMSMQDSAQQDAKETTHSKKKTRLEQKHLREFRRASELPSPMQPGHFLREFGQSDRDVIGNADSRGSIPQALSLMNHWFHWPLTHRSALRDAVDAIPSMDDKLEYIFVSIRSRMPNDRERELLASAKDRLGNKAVSSVAWSLLNTQEFLFIQ